MLDRLFSMKSSTRERLYRAFSALPRALRRAILTRASRYAKDRLANQETPSRLILYVTDRCNANCAHCFYARHLNPAQRDELGLDEIELLAKSLTTPLQSLVLTGGEPTLRDELPEICRIFDTHNGTRLVTITTNGIRTEDILSQFKEILRSCRFRVNAHVSLDGMKRTHERLRSAPGSFDHAVETARALKKLGARQPSLNLVSVLTCICSQNLDELADLIRFVRDDLGLFHKFQFVRGSHSDVHEIDPSLLSDFEPANPDCIVRDPTQMELAYELVRDSERLGQHSLMGKRQLLLLTHAMRVTLKNERTTNCLAGQIDGVVYPNGDVAVCEMTRPFGNLRNWGLDFREAWHSAEADTRRAETRSCYCTHPCNLSTSLSYDADALLDLSEPRPTARA